MLEAIIVPSSIKNLLNQNMLDNDIGLEILLAGQTFHPFNPIQHTTHCPNGKQKEEKFPSLSPKMWIDYTIKLVQNMLLNFMAQPMKSNA